MKSPAQREALKLPKFLGNHKSELNDILKRFSVEVDKKLDHPPTRTENIKRQLAGRISNSIVVLSDSVREPLYR